LWERSILFWNKLIGARFALQGAAANGQLAHTSGYLFGGSRC
jgi:hypothetical protein